MSVTPEFPFGSPLGSSTRGRSVLRPGEPVGVLRTEAEVRAEAAKREAVVAQWHRRHGGAA